MVSIRPGLEIAFLAPSAPAASPLRSKFKTLVIIFSVDWKLSRLFQFDLVSFRLNLYMALGAFRLGVDEVFVEELFNFLVSWIMNLSLSILEHSSHGGLPSRLLRSAR